MISASRTASWAPSRIKSAAEISRILRFTGPFQAFEQDFHVLAEQPLPELGVDAGADQFVLGHGYEFIHDSGSQDQGPAAPLKLSHTLTADGC